MGQIGGVGHLYRPYNIWFFLGIGFTFVKVAFREKVVRKEGKACTVKRLQYQLRSAYGSPAPEGRDTTRLCWVDPEKVVGYWKDREDVHSDASVTV